MPTDNDKISSDIGDNGQNIAAGKGIEQTNLSVSFTPPPPEPPGRYGPDHPARQYTFADIVVALIGDPLTGEPGLVGKVKILENATASSLAYQEHATAERKKLIEEIEDLRRGQYPRWFQLLIIVLAVAMIVLVSIFLVKVW